jgi:hypothetical protein
MHNLSSTDPELIEIERKSRELTRFLFSLCEKRMATHAGKPTPEHLALAASAMTLQRT